jgi:hypothetical protein
VPGVPVVPVLAVLTSLYLMLNLPGTTWIRFAVWMAIGLVVYFTYGAGHSRLVTDPNYSREADKAGSSDGVLVAPPAPFEPVGGMNGE